MNIRQIAKQAGVSVATVSRVLNHPENVAPRTREKIEKIIAETEYTPNWFARGLNFNKTGTIGLMIPHILDSVHMEIAKGVEDVAHQKDYIALMCNVEHDAEKERRYLNRLIKRKVDGIAFICSSLEKEDFELVQEQNIPVVLIGEHKNSPGFHVVSVDCRQAAKKAVTHLLGNGHKKIAFLYGKYPKVENEYKMEGYKDVLSESGIPVREDYLRETENTIEGGYLGAKKLMEQEDPPTAIFTSSDSIAFGAMDAIKDKELRIPEDVAVMGFNNVRMSNLVEPKLTTLDVPLHKMGIYGARLLFDIIENEEDLKQEKPKTILLQTKLKIRKSCGHKERIGEMF
ncbi:LacI family transcriptional regulator [bacterium 210820-DFI.6.37]|nr:LacI family transcriptional regulator [bacterium 210820-DFI.6.37]